jgi:predicted phage terminase large subunit-like protein
LVIDDPHSAEQAESDLQRQHALERFRTTLATRLDDKTNGAIVVVMQRLHTQDLSGLCLDLGFDHLCLEALPSHRTTVVFPRSGQEIVREAEEPLWPAREDRQALEELCRILGTYAFAGQYNQRPVPRSGGYFRREWWSFFDELPADRDFRILQSWDLTFKDGDGSDFVVGLVIAQAGATVYILDRFRAKLGFVDTVRAIKTMVAKYPTTSVVLIEDAANGPAVVDTLKRDIRGLIAVSPEGGKQSRANAVQAQCEARQVFLPRPTTPDGKPRVDRGWVEDFITILAAFPKGPHDDDVDALTQALVWLSQHHTFGPCFAVSQPEPGIKPRLCMWRTSFAPRPNLSENRISDWIYGRGQLESDDDDLDEGTP